MELIVLILALALIVFGFIMRSILKEIENIYEYINKTSDVLINHTQILKILVNDRTKKEKKTNGRKKKV